MRGLLDTDLLEGPLELYTRLRPSRCAVPIPNSDLKIFRDRVRELCQYWAGSGWPLLPVSADGISSIYAERLKSEAIDLVRDDLELSLPRRVEQSRVWATPLVHALASQTSNVEIAVEVVDLADTDPWRDIYTAVLGTLPDVPSENLMEHYHFRTGLAYADIFRIERASATGSIDDLVGRLGPDSKLSPRRLSGLYLASGMKPDTSFMNIDRGFPSEIAVRRAAGPNILVAVAEGSVEDLTYLWNLRAAHGDRYTMPVGVPLSLLSNDTFRYLQKPGRAVMFGWSGGPVHVTSWSTPIDELRARVSDQAAVFATPDDLFSFGPAPGRPGSQIAYWSGGRASVMPTTESDDEVLSSVVDAFRGGSLLLDIEVDGHPIPADQTMRGARFGPHYRAGAAQVEVNKLRERDTVTAFWPSGWTSLAATAQTRGLTVKPSEAGMAATTLLRALGGIDKVRWLLHPPLVDLFYRLAERSGMSWWKGRWQSAAKALHDLGIDSASIEEVAVSEGRDEPAIAPAGEGRELSIEEFRKALGGKRDAAVAWVSWAERKHLLVRGATIRCPECHAPSWLPMISLPPPVGCPGCGREIAQPYGPDTLKFRYRLGESLRRVLEADCLGHVFALHWATQIFNGSGSLVGAHPGVTFTDPKTGKDVGEADLLLLFRDGKLVPWEVKRRATGLDERAVELMGILSDALGSPWDAFVVTEAASNCTEAARLQKPMPGRPRFLLTFAQLMESHPMWTLGANPFAWNADDSDLTRKQQEDFIKSVQDDNFDKPWDFVSDTLLNRELD